MTEMLQVLWIVMIAILGYVLIGILVVGIYNGIALEENRLDGDIKAITALFWFPFVALLMFSSLLHMIVLAVDVVEKRVRGGHGEGGTDGKTGEGGGCCGWRDERQHQSRQEER